MLQLEIKSDAPDLEIVQNLVRAAIDAEIKNLQRSLVEQNHYIERVINLAYCCEAHQGNAAYGCIL